MLIVLLFTTLMTFSSEEELETLKENLIPSKIFLYPCSELWPIAKHEAKRFDIGLVDEMRRIIQTSWMDNTLYERFINLEYNLKSSLVKFTISLGEGRWKNKEACRLSIFKNQKVYFEEDWINFESDTIAEDTFFYRIKKLYEMKNKISPKKDIVTKKEIAREKPVETTEEIYEENVVAPQGKFEEEQSIDLDAVMSTDDF